MAFSARADVRDFCGGVRVFHARAAHARALPVRGLVFAAPLAWRREMAAVFAILTASCFFNWLTSCISSTPRVSDSRTACDFCGGDNLVAFALAVDFGLGLTGGAGPLWQKLTSYDSRLLRLNERSAGLARATTRSDRAHAEPLSLFHGCAPTIVLGAGRRAAATRLWHLGHPRRSSSMKFTSWRRLAITSAPNPSRPHPPLPSC